MDAISVLALLQPVLQELPASYALALLAALYGLTHLLAWLPAGQPGSLWARVRRVLDLVAGNYGAAANTLLPRAQQALEALRKPPQAPLVLALLLSGGLALSACATTPADHASRVAVARSGYVLAHAVVAQALTRSDIPDQVRAGIQLADAAAQAAIEGWASAPADDAEAQRAAAAMAALSAALEEAGLLLRGTST